MKAGQGFEKNNRKPHEFFPFQTVVLIAVLCIAGYCLQKGYEPIALLYNILLVFLALLQIWICWIKAYRQDRLSYDNGEHPCRFWFCVGLGFLALFGMCFLPPECWFSAVGYLLLTLFGNAGLGITGGTVLLLIPSLIREIPIDILMIQFIGGIYTALVFQRYNGEEKIAKPAVKALAGILFIQVLAAVFQGKGGREYWYRLLFGTAVTVVFFLGCLLYFTRFVLHRNRRNYARLTDPEGELLTSFRERSRVDYLKSVHTAYFCEEIAVRMGWSRDMMKCAAYYYKWGSDLPELIKKERFPKRCGRILMDYFDSEMADIPQVRHRETAALVCADVVLGSMIYLVNSGSELPRYDVVIDAIFDRMNRKGTFDKCEISGRELCTIKKIFKEETYYYDSLRRK